MSAGVITWRAIAGGNSLLDRKTAPKATTNSLVSPPARAAVLREAKLAEVL